MEPKVTIMRLKVDLQCRKCYMKVKKVLCKYPQIRDQLYDEKHDIVTIKVVCCSPEKVRDNICCQGGGSIKSIEIVEPQKPKLVVEMSKEPEKKPKSENKPKLEFVPTSDPEPKQAKQNPSPSADVAAPAIMFPETKPISVLAYPSSVVPAGLFYGVGQGGAPGVYGRPIYDSYGWSRPCYMGHQHDYLCEEEASVCTIT